MSFGFDVLSIRSKYWCPPQNPLIVNVQPARLDLQASAVDSHLLALLMSPFCRAISAAAIRPATSAAIDEGDSPLCSAKEGLCPAGHQRRVDPIPPSIVVGAATRYRRILEYIKLIGTAI